MKRPIKRSESQTLITGVYRTGSEYLAQLVGCHSKVSVSMYSVNVLRFVFGRFDPISERKNYVAAINALGARLKARYGIDLDCELVMEALQNSQHVDYGLLYDLVMSSLYLNSHATHWAEKNQLLWRQIPRFLDMMPNGKAILILRDPRSVLVSFKKYTYAPSPAFLGAIFNCYDAMNHAVRYQMELPSDRFLLLRYEDIARAPQQTAEAIWKLIGIEDRYPDVAKSANWRDAHGRSWRMNSSFHANDDLREFNAVDSVERWRAHIQPDELSLTEIVCGNLMSQFGYELSLLTNPDWISALRLFMKDEHVTGYFRRWLLNGEGIEEFPTDPLKPENWRSA